MNLRRTLAALTIVAATAVSLPPAYAADGEVARGKATTQPPSGSFEVHRRLANRAGTDRFVFHAKNVRSGQVCRGTVRL